MRKQGVCGGTKDLITFGDLILHHCIGYSADLTEALVDFSRGPEHDKVSSNVPFGWTKKVIVPFRVPNQSTINVTRLSAAHQIQLLPSFFFVPGPKTPRVRHWMEELESGKKTFKLDKFTKEHQTFRTALITLSCE